MEEGEKSPSSSQNINNGCSESNPSAPSGSQNETQTATAHGPSKKMSVRDFEILYRVGKGAFGNVFLVRWKEDGEIYAMKRMSKESMEARNQMINIKRERDILTKIYELPWFVSLFFSFQDHNYLYLVMEFVSGGDMRNLLSRRERLGEREACFYVAEMIIAVGCLHQLGYLHRDLKPDNFLIGADGHVKLADFGLSKSGLKEKYMTSMKVQPKKNGTLKRTGQPGTGNKLSDFRDRSQFFREHRRKLAYSIVGSPDYMAYELLMGEGYDFSVDWWSLGIILFEMIVGVPPFFAQTPMDVFANIKNFTQSLTDLEGYLAEEAESSGEKVMSPQCWDFIRSLLSEPEKRLGTHGGIEEIFGHPFFSGFDWKNIRSMDPPFVPTLESETDLRYFEHQAYTSAQFEKEEIGGGLVEVPVVQQKTEEVRLKEEEDRRIMEEELMKLKKAEEEKEEEERRQREREEEERKSVAGSILGSLSRFLSPMLGRKAATKDPTPKSSPSSSRKNSTATTPPSLTPPASNSPTLPSLKKLNENIKDFTFRAPTSRSRRGSVAGVDFTPPPSPTVSPSVSSDSIPNPMNQ